MGHQAESQEKLFYSFSLEAHVPQNHLLRGIHHYPDLSDLRQYLSQVYSHIGRPSIRPSFARVSLGSLGGPVALS